MKVECIVALAIHNFLVFSCYVGHANIVHYDVNDTLHTLETHKKYGIEIIVVTFDIDTRRSIHVAIYKPPKTHSKFSSTIKRHLCKSFTLLFNNIHR
jgi:hypothetical protein